MSFEQEWAALVGNARQERATAMQLNGASSPNGGGKDGGAGGSGGGKRLHVTPSVLRSYAGKADKVSESFAKTDDETMRETTQVPGSMKGFACDEAFADFQKTWREQMKYLNSLYTGVARALRTAATSFKAEDARRKADMDKVDPSQKNPSSPQNPNSPLLPNSPLYPGSPLRPYSPLLPPQNGEQPQYGPPYTPRLPSTSESNS